MNNKLYLDFVVRGMQLARTNQPNLTEGSNKYIYARFKFDNSWEGLDKFLLVARANETYTIKLEDDQAEIEFEAIRTSGAFDIGLIGSKGDVVVTTNPLTIKVNTTEFKNNPTGSETRLTNDFLIRTLEAVKVQAEDVHATVDELPIIITNYINSHKAELKGDKGDKGDDGYTPIKNIDYFDGKDGKDGYTPIKNIDYFDGKDGKDGATGQAGADGKSVTVEQVSNGAKVTDGFGHSVVVTNGINGQNGRDGIDGKDGEIPTEQLAQIEANKQELIVQSGEIAKQAEVLAEAQKTIKDQQRQINFLHDMTEGIAWRKEIDTEEAYTKAIPKGSKGVTINSIGGKCIIENQMVNTIRYFGTSSSTIYNWVLNDNNVIKGILNADDVQSDSRVVYPVLLTYCSFINTHKYYISVDFDSDLNTLPTDYQFYAGSGVSTTWIKMQKGRNATIVTCSNDLNSNIIRIYFRNGMGTTGQFVEFKNYQCVDLTTEWGAGNEPDLEFCQQYYTSYRPYTEPTIKTIYCDCVEVVGANMVNSDVVFGAISGETKIGEYYSFHPAYAHNIYSAIKGGVPSLAFLPNTQYSINFVGKNESIDNKQTLGVGFAYTDGTSSSVVVNSMTENQYTLVSTQGKTVKCLFMTYYNSLRVYVKDFCVKQSANTEYSPYNVQTIPIPQSVLDLDCYGVGVNDCRNRIYWQDNRCKYEQRMAKVDLGSLTWNYMNNSFRTSGIRNSWKLTNLPSQKPNVLCEKYSTVLSYSDTWNIDKCICQTRDVALAIYDSSYTSADTSGFKQAMQGVYLYYELAEPIVTTVEMPADFENNTECEGNGSITFRNTLGEDYRVPLPNEVEYIVKVSEAL